MPTVKGKVTYAVCTKYMQIISITDTHYTSVVESESEVEMLSGGKT